MMEQHRDIGFLEARFLAHHIRCIGRLKEQCSNQVA
jgi:hypothetical protein